MSVNPDLHRVSLVLLERIVTQLEALVRRGHFANRQDAVATAVERLYAEAETHPLTATFSTMTRNLPSLIAALSGRSSRNIKRYSSLIFA
jgi:Arc/MetJ-type ribon-helix-helix transcriptional regulator